MEEKIAEKPCVEASRDAIYKLCFSPKDEPEKQYCYSGLKGFSITRVDKIDEIKE
jgi:hypothetical protein